MIEKALIIKKSKKLPLYIAPPNQPTAQSSIYFDSNRLD